ncbi:MAG: glycosyltransferase family 4 protein [Acidimicrobiales bacterium]
MIARILQVTAYYPPHLGGQEIAVQGLSRELARRGREVDVVSSDRGAVPGRRREEGVVVTRLRSVEIGHSAVIPGLLPALLRAAADRPIVHLHVGQAFVPEIAWIASRLRRFDYFLQLHADLRPSGAAGVFLPPYKRMLLARVVRDATAVLLLNREHAGMLREDFGYTGKIAFVQNGLDDEWFNSERGRGFQGDGPVRLVYVGRLAPAKNISALVDALVLLGESVSLEIIGDGAEGRALRQRVAARGVNHRVSFLGALSRAAVIERLQAADALVLPSLHESFGLVLLEAMAAEVPIIATDVVGIRELVGDCSLLTDPSAEGLASAIRRFQGLAPGAIAQMVAAGRRKAEQYRWSVVGDEYEAVYERGG